MSKTIITIEDVSSPYKGRAEVNKAFRISATHNPFIGGEQVPTSWLTAQRVTDILQMLGHKFKLKIETWSDPYVREMTEESVGVWFVWIYQEYLD